jgi:hypothetical protein
MLYLTGFANGVYTTSVIQSQISPVKVLVVQKIIFCVPISGLNFRSNLLEFLWQ